MFFRIVHNRPFGKYKYKESYTGIQERILINLTHYLICPPIILVFVALLPIVRSGGQVRRSIPNLSAVLP
jgi:hypothetical protein